MDNINLTILNSLKTKQPAYSIRMSYLCSMFSGASYFKFEHDDLKKLERFLDAAGFVLVECFCHNGSEAYLAHNNDFAVIAFRGTEPTSWEDIKSDINCDKMLTVYGKAHEGFLKYVNRISRQVSSALDKISLPIYVTGHSLGGAASELYPIIYPNENMVACYSFGAPRIGNKTFCDSSKIPIYRVVNYVDPVPCLPLYSAGWRHPGDLRYITSGGSLSSNPSGFVMSRNFLVSLFTRPKKTFADYHPIENYSKYLEDIALKKLKG